MGIMRSYLQYVRLGFLITLSDFIRKFTILRLKCIIQNWYFVIINKVWFWQSNNIESVKYFVMCKPNVRYQYASLERWPSKHVILLS